MKEVSLLSPASVSNVVCGFDTLGFALSAPADEMRLELTDRSGVEIIHLDGFGLTTDPEHNIAGAALLSLLRSVDDPVGFRVEIKKNIKPGSGIGSSAASAAGAVVAANRLLGDRFSKNELLEFAMDGEVLASGARHADNLAPIIYGGFTLIRSVDPMDIIPLEPPPLWAAVIHPQIEIKTSYAREILPKEVPLSSAIRQWANLGALIAGITQHDYALIARSLEDYIVEPVRSPLIPGFDELKKASLAAGALGGGISGSGPSVFMLCETEPVAEAVEAAMAGAYSATGIEFHTYVSPINPDGVRFY